MNRQAEAESDSTANWRQRWLDKLWQQLFSSEASGLMSPGQIRRENRDRGAVRQLEMRAIFEAEGDVDALNRGLKHFDAQGRLVKTPKVGHVHTHAIIEDVAVEQHQDIGLNTAASMLEAVMNEVRVRDLGRSLNLRKIILLAESEIYSDSERIISSHPVNAEWLLGWREVAQDVLNPELQSQLARIMVLEIARPGQFSYGAMMALRNMSPEELEMLRIISQYALGPVIYNASDDYFKGDIHQQLFEAMDDAGIISGAGLEPQLRRFTSSADDSFELQLATHDKALRITAADPSSDLILPVYKFTRVGRQLVRLQRRDGDLAYLLNLARHIKHQGFEVALGDWVPEPTGERGVFTQKMKV